MERLYFDFFRVLPLTESWIIDYYESNNNVFIERVKNKQEVEKEKKKFRAYIKSENVFQWRVMPRTYLDR